MSKRNVMYGYDVDTGELATKTVFRDSGKIDLFTNINHSGYGHYVYSNSIDYYENEKGSEFTREYKEDPTKKWDDRDGVFGNGTTENYLSDY